jgi:hypothetical protein
MHLFADISLGFTPSALHLRPEQLSLAMAIMVGLLLSISAGIRSTVPLLAISVLAYRGALPVPARLDWLSSETSVIILSVAALVELAVHFIPAIGTAVRAAATPLAFVAGTIAMAVPLGDHNPLIAWTLAGVVGGGTAMLTHLGFTGLRAASAPANVATVGLFGLAWNAIEMVLSLLFTVIGGICVFVGWFVGALALLILVAACLVFAVRASMRLRRLRPV